MPIYVSVSILQISSPSAVLWDPSRWSRQACIRSRWSMSGKSLLGDVDGDFPRFFSSLSFFPSRFLSRSSFFKSHGVRLSLFVHSIWFYTRRPLDVKCNRYYFPISTRELCRLFLLSYLGRDHLQFFISSTLDFRDVIFCLLVFVFPVHLVHR